MNHKAKISTTVVLLLACLFTGLPLAFGSNDTPHEEKGYQETSYDLSNYESINLASGNLTFRVPLHTLRTDGGLEYPIAAIFNSKFWAPYRYCNLGGDVGDCAIQQTGDVILAEIANGVSEYGFGWDLRPPRIQDPTQVSSLQARSYVSSSGSVHFLQSGKPWSAGGGGGAPLLGSDTVGDESFTGDGTNLRFTVRAIDAQNNATSVTMEDGYGRVYVFSQIVPLACNADLTEIDDQSDLDDFNFKTDLAGLYLTEIQQGPWDAIGGLGIPTNRITFTYLSSGHSWNDQCPTSSEPWLISTITAESEADRTVTFNYSGGVLASVSVPTFDPSLGDDTSGSTATITWGTETSTFLQHHAYLTPTFDAAHLTSVQFPTGEEFSFDNNVGSNFFLPMSDVKLPSGAAVTYLRSYAYPTGCAAWTDAPGDEGPDTTWRAVRCGKYVSPLPLFPNGTAPGPRCEESFGVTSREITYLDASGERTETTWFRQQLSCTATEYFDDDGNNTQWPYDFNYALRDDGDLPGEVLRSEYLWTVVATQTGDDTDFGPVSPAAEIHRFHWNTGEEFSIDQVAGTGVIYLLGRASANAWFREGLDEISDLRVLRHQEIEQSVLGDAPDIKNADGHNERYTYTKRTLTFTDETTESASADIKSTIDPCYPNVTPGGSATITCTEVEKYRNVDDYLNPTGLLTYSYRSESGTEVDRCTGWTYDDTNAEDPYVWALHRKTSESVFDCDTPSSGIRTEYTWTDLSDDATGAYEYHVPYTEILNPANHACATDDCVQHTYGYDVVGNQVMDTIGGGYGTSGFNSLTPMTRTTYRHGTPTKKELVAGLESLLLWEREIDPNTGLARWHVDGSGVGFAYLWDELGRPTDIAPVRGDWTDQDPGESGFKWYLYHQKTDASGLTPVNGKHITYIPATSSTLLRHKVYDETWSGSLIESALVQGTIDTTERAAAHFDGLGRLTKETETYPQGTRSKYHLRFIHEPEDDFSQCDSNETWDIADKGQVVLDSEWVDGTTFPAGCALPWNETQLDPLGRPAVSRLPDGFLTTSSFWGDTTTETTRTIATSISALDGESQTTDLSSTAINDALGRLIVLEEEEGTGSAFLTGYTYDYADRLLQVDLYESGTSPVYAQSRSFTYTDAGFLESSEEPERSITYLGYDAAGNVTKKTRTNSFIYSVSDYDDFGRFLSTVLASQTIIENTWSTSGIGADDYNRLESSTRHNRFGSTDVEVTHNWTYGGPATQVSTRTTEVAGLGAAGDAFQIWYGYDEWGNRSEVYFPLWDSCRDSDFAKIRNTYEGSWPTESELVNTQDTSAEVATATYHPSGRPETIVYGTYGTYPVTRTELANIYGMARPRNITISGGSADLIIPGTTGIYGYDGAGNIWKKGANRYTYDGLSRLVSHQDYDPGGGGRGTLTPVKGFSYDRWGNQTQIQPYDAAGNPEPALDFVMSKDANDIPTTNRINTVNDNLSKSNVSLTWDARGNLAIQPAVGPLPGKTDDWSEDDRLMESTDTATGAVWRYAYDAAGERVARWTDPGPGTEAVVTIRDEGGQEVSTWRTIPGTQYFMVASDSVHFGGSRIAEINHEAGPDMITFISSDHLGSPMVLFDQAGDLVDWMEFEPYGALRAGGSVFPETNFLFTGHERDLGTTTSELDYMHARYYSPGLARFVSVDPISGSIGRSQSWNRYSYVLNNPIGFVDPKGESTHTTTDGTVVAVYDDSDLTVYAHNSLSGWDGSATLPSSGKGVSAMGNTANWDEFLEIDASGSHTGNIAFNAKIEFGTSFDSDISALNSAANGMSLAEVASESTTGGKFDIKNDLSIAPSGPYTGRLLNGSYASARSAGNFLAGMNGATGKLGPTHLNLNQYMRMAGAVHTGNWNKSTAAGILFTNLSYGPAPYYGEIPYAGRQIQAGFLAGIKLR